MSLDRRRSPRERRTSARSPLIAGVLERLGAARSLAQTGDIGPQGMRLVRTSSDGERPPETAVHLRFQLPGGGLPIDVSAEVVFDRPQGGFRSTGLRFADLDRRDEQRIADFVSRTRR